jgi:hypothetical protein
VAALVSRVAEVRSREWERGNYALLAVAGLSIAVVALAVALGIALRQLGEKRIVFGLVGELGDLHLFDVKGTTDRSDPALRGLIEAQLYGWAKNYYERRHGSMDTQMELAMAFMNVPKAEELKTAIRDGLVDDFEATPGKPEIVVERGPVMLHGPVVCGDKEHPLCSATVEFKEESMGKKRACGVDLRYGYGTPQVDGKAPNALGLAVVDWKKECGPEEAER